MKKRYRKKAMLTNAMQNKIYFVFCGIKSYFNLS